MKKRWILVLLVGAIGVGALTLDGDSETVKVTTAVLSSGRVEQTVTCTGVVESAKATGVFLPVPCMIDQVCVKEGDRVKKGDVLAVIDKQATFDTAGNEAVRLQLAAMAEEVTAPESGVGVGVNALGGAPTEMGIPCVLLALERDLQVRICLREKDLQVIRQGMPVRLSGDGFTRQVYTGSLADISAAARTDTGAGTIVEGVVKLDAGQVDTSLRLGLTARATVVTAVTEAGVLVPHEAVLSDEEGAYVYLLKDGCAVRQNLKVMGQVAAGILLTDRSLEGQKVICNPTQIQKENMMVQEETS